MSEPQTPWRCCACDLPVSRWYHGWQHLRGGNSKPSRCAGKPTAVYHVKTNEVLRVNTTKG
jgi:hypothetical protein